VTLRLHPGAEKGIADGQSQFLGQESALLANKANFWVRKMLCWRAMLIPGAGKCLAGEQCPFLTQEAGLSKFFSYKKALSQGHC